MTKGNMAVPPPSDAAVLALASVPAVSSLQRLRRVESNTSVASARDSKFWLAVASASASSGASFSSSSASSRNGSFLRRGSALELAKDASARSLRRIRTVRCASSSGDRDLGLSIDVLDDDDDDTDDVEADEAESHSERRLTPITSPPAPSQGLCRPTVLQNHRHRSAPVTSDAKLAVSTQSSVAPKQVISPPAPPLAQAPVPVPLEIVVEEVYEHQRYQRLLGWGSKGHLMPMDPGKYVRVVRRPEKAATAGKRRPSLTRLHSNTFQAIPSPTFPDLALPDAPSDTKGEWISPWHLEYPTRAAVTDSGATDEEVPLDPDGWIYASGFNQFASWKNDSSTSIDNPTLSENVCTSPMVNSRGRPKYNARRRKWIRYRRLRSSCDACTADPLAGASGVSPFDDSFLDSMCGWLRKLGHVRKNWKMRYFVLEKSVLRYFADEAMTRLKGEVLLFHPAAQVHYVDIHLSNGRDNTFAIQVGPEYTLMLEAVQVSDRENWMYCIEDALLCRDSYLQDPTRTQDVQESVARRRNFSSETILYSTNGESSSGINPMNMLMLHSKAVVQATRKNPLMMRLMVECDAFLESKLIKQQIASFLKKFKQKYGGSISENRVTSLSKTTTPLATGTLRRTSSYSSVETRGSDVPVCQDPRSLLALKNYRFFLERAMAEAMEHLTTLPFVNATCNATSPRSVASMNTGRHGGRDEVDCFERQFNCASPPMAGDIDWELAKKAILYKLERQTFIPLQDIIYNLLEALVDSEYFDRFERNRHYVANQSQGFFEIHESQHSPSDWKSARAMLDSMDNYSLPTEKASVLLDVAKCIYDTYATEHAVDVQAMAADDFLPIFIFVLARSKLRNVVVARHLISETMISCVMIGETGYYATMFEAAISYISSYFTSEEAGEHFEHLSISRIE